MLRRRVSKSSMPDLRMGIVLFEDRLFAWQAETIAALRAIPGLEITLLHCAHGPKTAFVAPRRSRAFRRVETDKRFPLCALESSDLSAFDWVVNLTRARPDQPWVQLRFADDARPGGAEIRAGTPVSEMFLQQGAMNDIALLGYVCLKTAANLRRNCDALMAAAPLLFARAARAAALDVPSEMIRPPSPRPLSCGARIVRRIEKWRAKFSKASRWTVGFISADIRELIRRRALAPATWLSGLPEGRFFADPFPVTVEARRVVVLAENGDEAPPHKGHISEIAFDRSGVVTEVRDAIATPQHMSFPFPVRIAGKVYCLPECCESGALRLFGEDSSGWAAEATILDGVAAVDPVLLRHDGRWWLFCSDRAHEDTAHLFLYSAEELAGPWRAHPLNPIKSDVRGSRGAGAIVEVDGALYRPAQDCSVRYGGAIAMQRITRLSETDYAEETAFVLEPASLGRRFIGIHTINGLADVTVIDGLRR